MIRLPRCRAMATHGFSHITRDMGSTLENGERLRILAITALKDVSQMSAADIHAAQGALLRQRRLVPPWCSNTR